jgi:HK97 family phage major capsid protein
MRTLEEIQADVNETGSLYEMRKINQEAAELRLAALREEKLDIERALARKGAPNTDGSTGGHFREVAKAMLEKRDITLNGTAALEVVKTLMKELQPRTPILQGIHYYYGAGDTQIPVLSPTIAQPVPVAEGATGLPSDQQAQLNAVKLIPAAYFSELAVSYETLRKGAVDFEGELPKIFADAFAQGFHKQVLTGSGGGNNMQGIFTAAASAVGDNKLTCATAGTVAIGDLVQLATAIQDKADNANIIIAPKTYGLIMADPTTGLADLYKEELIRTKTIEGVKVLITSGAPSSTASGDVVAAALRLDDYAIGIADQLTIIPINVRGDTNTYYQAVMLANGRIPVQKNLWALVAAAPTGSK